MEQPEKAGTAGNRDLAYDVISGMFRLKTKSYVKSNCKMDFEDYPFDTQTCNFTIAPIPSLRGYQVIM